MGGAADDVVWVVGHKRPDTDSICAAIAYAELKQTLGDRRVRAARAGELNAETRWTLARFALPEPTLLTRATGLQLILVDHNETAQALDDIAHATVLEIWEHHRIGDLLIPRPIVFHCEPVGATATLIAEQYLLHDVPFPGPVAGGLLAAILSDTLVLESPTTSGKDRQMAQRLAVQAGVKLATFGAELMAARGSLSGQPVPVIIDSDCKEFDFAGHRVGIAQVETLDVAPLLERRAAFLQELASQCATRGLVQMILMVTDIRRKGSHLWFAGDQRAVLERALERPVPPDGVWMPGWMSRKKQLVPALELAFCEQSEGGRA